MFFRASPIALLSSPGIADADSVSSVSVTLISERVTLSKRASYSTSALSPPDFTLFRMFLTGLSRFTLLRTGLLQSPSQLSFLGNNIVSVSYTHLRAHETVLDI